MSSQPASGVPAGVKLEHAHRLVEFEAVQPFTEAPEWLDAISIYFKK